VTSVGLVAVGDLSAKKINAWMSQLIQAQGKDIYRMKGILAIEGDANRFVFQAVHMQLDGNAGAPWQDAPRRSAIVFIGRGLDRAALEAGFRGCLVKPAPASSLNLV
jgi:G3E family GTPase